MLWRAQGSPELSARLPSSTCTLLRAGGNVFIRNNQALQDLGPLALAGANLSIKGRVVVEGAAEQLPRTQVQALVSRGKPDA
jgi:hypothetical protein